MTKRKPLKLYDPKEKCPKCGSFYKVRHYPKIVPERSYSRQLEERGDEVREHLELMCGICFFVVRRAPLDSVPQTPDSVVEERGWDGYE